MTQTTGDMKANWGGNLSSAGCYSVLQLMVNIKPISLSAPKST